MQKLCPTCHQMLNEVERLGVLVDVCPQCQGVWLEHGEMEKIIGYIRGTMTPPTRPEAVEPRRERVMYDEPRYPEARRRERYDDDDNDYERRRRKRRFELDDILDIFGD